MLVVAVILLLSSLFHTALSFLFPSGGTLEIKFIEYKNPDGKHYTGSCCDDIFPFGCVGSCDNYFVVCYRDYNPSDDNACTDGNRTTDYFYNNDDITFPKSHLDNPFSFGFDAWKNSFSLKITIWDDDSPPFKDDLVDVLRLGIAHASVPSNWSSLVTLYGKYGKTLSLQWRVRCNTYYYGNCSVYCKPQDFFLLGHYTCDPQTGQRLCLAGWTGAPQCRTPICKTGCSKLHGSCTRPGECICDPGWTGSTCSNICVPKSGCKHGFCQSGNDCICQPPWFGPLCDQDGSACNSRPCENGGTCSVISNGFSCDCPSGFTGSTCTVDMNLCQSNPCMHGATCQNLPNGFECKCRPGYTGHFCSTEINECLSNPCVYGICSDLVNAFSCRCHYGYTGRRCDADSDECASGLNNCGANTVCQNTVRGYLCPCQPGYADTGDGRSCTRIQCKNLDSLLAASAARVTFSNDNRWVGTTAHIICRGGYKMQPGSLWSLRCLDDGEWDGEVNANICSDIDECQLFPPPCFLGEVCRNTVGSYICETEKWTQAPTTISPCSDGDTAECGEGTPGSVIDEKNNSSNIGLYVGVAVGVFLLIVIIIVILLVVRRRSKRESITIVPPPPTQYEKPSSSSSSSSMAMTMSACQAAVDKEHVNKEHVNAERKHDPFYDAIGDRSPPPTYEDMSAVAFDARNLAYGSVLYANDANGAENSLAETGVAAAENLKDRPASEDQYVLPDVKGGGGVDVQLV
ncbi:protein jagged-1-like [Oscarella lobularis]|uniref:protein jagged-1-like n=1 Tax=Oscarella lobularis TaxID=121494 RepID=UPI0033144432